MTENKKKHLMKKLREMNVIDNFLFQEIMVDEERGKEACRLILGRILNREIGEIDFTPEKVVPGVSEENHGIRMDAYITEHTNEPDKAIGGIRIYDLEPDKKSDKKNELPKRSRYYTDLIDVQLLETSVNYDKLPELVSIFILSYDPFGADAMIYEAGSIIKTHPDIPYDDGIRRLFLYVDGKLPENAGENEKKLKALLKYIGSSTEENVTDEEIRRLNAIVKTVKSKKDVGVRFMKSWEREYEIREEGREEGRKEERLKTEAEKQRADEAEAKAGKAEEKASKAEAELAKYKAKFGEIA